MLSPIIAATADGDSAVKFSSGSEAAVAVAHAREPKSLIPAAPHNIPYNTPRSKMSHFEIRFPKATPPIHP